MAMCCLVQAHITRGYDHYGDSLYFRDDGTVERTEGGRVIYDNEAGNGKVKEFIPNSKYSSWKKRERRRKRKQKRKQKRNQRR